MPDVDLSSLSPGTRTHLGILRLKGSTITDRGGHLVVRTPTQPTFHWGNCLFVTDDTVNDADRWISTFHHEFPDADWLAIGLPTPPTHDTWQHHHVDVELEEALTLDRLPQDRPLPPGYHVREFQDDDWTQLRELDQREQASTDRQDPTSYLAFLHGQEAARRALAADGHLAWFGAFTDHGLLAASLGIVLLDDDTSTARYQSVVTAPEHRRHGLAGHLLGVAGRWATARGANELVIVTENTNPAARLYRSVGFHPAQPAVTAYRAPARR